MSKGKGLANATVIFHTQNPAEGFIKPRATTDADGGFAMTTYESGDGAPVGDYEVTIEQWINGNPDVGPTNRLSVKLGVPSTSGLKAIVAASENTLPAFELR